MAQWLLYVLVVSALLSVSGWLIEWALRQRRLPTRYGWVAAIGLTVLLAYHALPFPVAPQTPLPSASRHSWTAIQRIAPVKLPPVISQPQTAAAYTSAMQWDVLIIRGWLLSSLVVTLALVSSGIAVFWRRRSWPMRLLGSHCVGIAPDTGPAVVGLLRPTIVIPRWVLDAEAAQQQLILAHEASHLQARDPLLLTCALVAVILMPWNVLLWWQLYRLRHAIEVDCDSRVLDAGIDTQAYGEILIEVGQRRSRFIGTVAAMSESRTLLEKRIEIMTTRARKVSAWGFAGPCALALSVTLAATQVTSPEDSNTKDAPHEISVDTATLDHYVGKYSLAPNAVLTITRDGTQLSAVITGQPKLPIYAETPTKFFWKVVKAQVTFATDASGNASSATIHQNGHDIVAPRMDGASAERIEERLAQRVSNQQPQPGSEAMLRMHIASFGTGNPNYNDMTPTLREAAEPQRPLVENLLKELGPVQTVEFKGVSPAGLDKYLVTHQSGKQTEWFIQLDAAGKIAGLAVRPPF